MNTSENLLILRGLEGHPPATLYPAQEFLVGAVPEISVGLWILWTGVLFFVILRYVFGVELLRFLRKVS